MRVGAWMHGSDVWLLRAENRLGKDRRGACIRRAWRMAVLIWRGVSSLGHGARRAGLPRLSGGAGAVPAAPRGAAPPCLNMAQFGNAARLQPVRAGLVQSARWRQSMRSVPSCCRMAGVASRRSASRNRTA